jgi:hypothetical protein
MVILFIFFLLLNGRFIQGYPGKYSSFPSFVKILRSPSIPIKHMTVSTGSGQYKQPVKLLKTKIALTRLSRLLLKSLWISGDYK